MQLTRYRVRKFRNIVDSGDINVTSDVTCLVGMNEAGKTAVLAALHRLNPANGAMFNTQQDYPRWLLTKDRKAGVIGEARPIEAVFTVGDTERQTLADKFGKGVLLSNTVTLYREYDDPTLWGALSADENKAVAHLLGSLTVPREAADALSSATTFKDLRERIASLAKDATDELTPLLTQATGAIDTLVGTDTLNEAMLKDLSVPKFFYFGEYSVLEGRVDLLRLSKSEGEETASTPDQTARSLLALADTTPAALCSDDYEDRRAELEAVSNDLSEQVFEYWKQNPSLRVRFDIDRKIEKDAQGRPHVTKNVLDIRVEDTRHYFTNNFSQRSSGFRWFFSFLAAFTEFESRNDAFVILLDEPGLTLHGRAQADFLRFINERLAPVAQVIYTTHSPFMVENDHIERVRIVEDKGPKDGAVVSQDVLSVGADSLFPLQAALGYDVAQHLFIGNHNLLVEGPSDFLYIDLMSRKLGGDKRTTLDERWRILPAGSASNIPAFIALIGRELEVTVLVDSGTEGAGRLDAAMEAGRLSKDRLIRIGEIISAKHADIEDLFTLEDYLTLYNRAFNRRLKASDLGHGDRIIRRLEEKHGRFDHYKPAELLLRDPKKLDAISEESLANFETLIKRVNETYRGS